MRGERLVRFGSVIVILSGVGMALGQYLDRDPGEPGGWYAAAGFAAPFIGAGLLALTGITDGLPGLVMGAGLALWIMGLVSIVTFPLSVLGIAWVVVASRSEMSPSDTARGLALGFPLMAAFSFLVFHQDPVSWTTTDGGGGNASNTVTSLEASISLATTFILVAIGIRLGRHNHDVHDV